MFSTSEMTWRALYKRDLILVRPDLHVVSRGDNLPTDCGDIVSRALGYSVADAPAPNATFAQ
jgi:hypothetical protein